MTDAYAKLVRKLISWLLMPFEIPYTDQKLIQKKQIRYFSEIFCLLTSEAGVSVFLTKKVLKQQRDVQSYTSNVTSNSYFCIQQPLPYQLTYDIIKNNQARILNIHIFFLRWSIAWDIKIAVHINSKINFFLKVSICQMLHPLNPYVERTRRN